MIKEIEKPKFKLNFIIPENAKYFYNIENKEYFLKSDNFKIYFNNNGDIHRDNNPALYSLSYKWFDYYQNNIKHREDGYAENLPHYLFKLNGITYHSFDFAKKTNHLVCKFCNVFCKQGCFL